VLTRELSNTLDTVFCLRTLNRAVKLTGTKSEIFTTDQSCQFMSDKWNGWLKELEIPSTWTAKAAD